MRLTQNQIEHLQDLLERGEITADQASVEKVKMARVQLVTCRIPAQVRKALSLAVKRGELGHWKKDEKKPEVYFHPDFEHLAGKARKDHERSIVKALYSVCASQKFES